MSPEKYMITKMWVGCRSMIKLKLWKEQMSFVNIYEINTKMHEPVRPCGRNQRTQQRSDHTPTCLGRLYTSIVLPCATFYYSCIQNKECISL